MQDRLEKAKVREVQQHAEGEAWWTRESPFFRDFFPFFRRSWFDSAVRAGGEPAEVFCYSSWVGGE